ncbi:hypothetical protein [Sulfitobacter aestuariivivens]|uniref:hypothetical protein n=1 Tax=Sulfitobacter aestuariivivens TaxID=2766981 RepID=UPI0036147679
MHLFSFLPNIPAAKNFVLGGEQQASVAVIFSERQEDLLFSNVLDGSEADAQANAATPPPDAVMQPDAKGDDDNGAPRPSDASDTQITETASRPEKDLPGTRPESAEPTGVASAKPESPADNDQGVGALSSFSRDKNWPGGHVPQLAAGAILGTSQNLARPASEMGDLTAKIPPN